MSDMGDLQDGRVVPEKLDVASKPRRKLRNLNRPEPSVELRELGKGARRRADKRQYPPGVMLEAAGMDEEHWTAPHSDTDLWMLQLADAFCTRSRAVIATFMGQLEALCGPSHWDDVTKQWRLDENQFSAALAIVNSVKPRNEMEAALAAQMVAIHLLTMKVAARALKYDSDTRTAATAAKLARAFTDQMAALKVHRQRGRTAKQAITVRKELHQHIHYHRGEGESDGQPHERDAAPADQRATLPSPEPGGEPLPLPGDEGQEAMQASRRG